MIYSAQSGDWLSTATWVGGNVPDLSTDDVVIAAYHTVTMDSMSFTLAGGRTITVDPDGMLEIWSALTVESGASLYVQGGMYVSGNLDMLGYVEVASGGWLDVYGGVAVLYGGSVDVQGDATVGPYAYFDVVYGSSLHVYGSFYQDWSAYSYFYQNAYVSVESSGWAYFDGYLYIEDYSQFHVYGDVDVSYSGNIEVRYYGELYIEYGGSLIARNYLNVSDWAYIYVQGDLRVEGSLYAYNSGQIVVENGGVLTITGYASIEYYSYLTIYQATLIVERWASLDLYYESTIYFDYQSRTELLGYFRLYYDAYLYLGWEALVRVYRGMDVSGRMDSSGGKIVILRREARINDADGESLFTFDQAYGYSPRHIA